MSKRRERAPSQRQLRVGEEIRHTLASIIERGEIRDPGLQGRSITITEVRLSPDMRNATVYCVPLGGGGDRDGEETEQTVAALNHAQPFLRRRVAELVRLRAVPAFVFAADPSFDEAGHIDTLLQSPRVRRDLEVAETGVAATEDDEETPDGA